MIILVAFFCILIHSVVGCLDIDWCYAEHDAVSLIFAIVLTPLDIQQHITLTGFLQWASLLLFTVSKRAWLVTTFRNSWHYFLTSGTTSFLQTISSSSIVGAGSHGTRPGPKSGRSGGRILYCTLSILSLLLLSMTTLHWNGGEGCTSLSLGSTEVSAPWTQDFIHMADAKRQGFQPTVCCGKNMWPSARTKIQKRSMRRAFRRAIAHGVAWYRGQAYTPNDFPLQLSEPMATVTRALKHSPIDPAMRRAKYPQTEIYFTLTLCNMEFWRPFAGST